MSAEIEEWLDQLGLGKYAKLFIESEVDLDAARDLTEDDLKDLGLPLGPRKKLLRAIEQLCGQPDEGEERPASTEIDPAVHPGDAERRHLTVMFCDLVGSTELATTLDPEEMHALLSAFQETCGRIASEHGGHVAKLLGDGLLIYFGYPKAHEDDGEQAVRSALEIVEAVQQIETPDQRRLQSRVGIASGVVVIGEILSGGGSDLAAVSGSVPHLAARLERAAAPNSVLIAKSTRQLIGRLFNLEQEQALDLKGFDHAIAAFRVRGSADVASRFAATRTAGGTAFVGRDNELGMLRDAWAAAVDAEGQAVLVSGEAGIGKSRLMAEFCNAVSGEKHTRVRYQCSPQHIHSPLYPVAAQLRRAARITGHESTHEQADKLEGLLRQAAPKVDAVAPLFADLLGIKDTDRYGDKAFAPEQFKALIFDALVSQLEGLASKQPVLLLFEDVHWADVLTTEMLARLVSESKRLPVMILVTTRPEEQPSWLELSQASHLSLNRIRRRGAVEIAENAAGSSLPSGILDEILERADGNPLFLEEITRSLVEGGPTEASVAAIPATLHDSLIARLDRLATEKDIAQIAAVIGRTFQVDLLVAASGQSDSDVEDALSKLVTAGIIFELPSARQHTYEFKHALIRDAAYDSLTKAARANYHHRVAECLEEHFPDIAETDPGLVAQHFIAAGSPDRSLRYLLQAGQIAHARFALVAAAGHLRCGLEILNNQPPSHDRDLNELPFQAALGATLNALDGYAAPSTEKAYERAHDLLHLTDDPKLKESVLSGLLALYYNQLDLPRFQIIANENLANAEAANNDQFLCSSYSRLANLNSITGNFLSGTNYGEKAVRHYDQEHHHDSHFYVPHNSAVRCFTHCSLPLWHVGRVREADQRRSEALSLALATDHPNTICYALFWHGLFANLLRRELRSVIESANKIMEVTSKHGMPHWEAIALCYLAFERLINEEPETALENLKQSRELVRKNGSVFHMPIYVSIAGEILVQQGQFSEAIATLEGALSDAKRTGEVWFNAELTRLMGEANLLQHPDDHTVACERFTSAMRIARDQGSKMFELRSAVSLANATTEKATLTGAVKRIQTLISEIDADDTAWDIQRAKAWLAAV